MNKFIAVLLFDCNVWLCVFNAMTGHPFTAALSGAAAVLAFMSLERASR
jgi:hypothetical protein